MLASRPLSRRLPHCDDTGHAHPLTSACRSVGEGARRDLQVPRPLRRVNVSIALLGKTDLRDQRIPQMMTVGPLRCCFARPTAESARCNSAARPRHVSTRWYGVAEQREKTRKRGKDGRGKGKAMPYTNTRLTGRSPRCRHGRAGQSSSPGELDPDLSAVSLPPERLA